MKLELSAAEALTIFGLLQRSLDGNAIPGRPALVRVNGRLQALLLSELDAAAHGAERERFNSFAQREDERIAALTSSPCGEIDLNDPPIPPLQPKPRPLRTPRHPHFPMRSL